MDTQNLDTRFDFSQVEQEDKGRIRSPVPLSPRGLGFPPECSGLYFPQVSLQNCHCFLFTELCSVPTSCTEPTNRCQICTVGSFCKCFPCKAILGKSREACGQHKAFQLLEIPRVESLLSRIDSISVLSVGLTSGCSVLHDFIHKRSMVRIEGRIPEKM